MNNISSEGQNSCVTVSLNLISHKKTCTLKNRCRFTWYYECSKWYLILCIIIFERSSIKATGQSLHLNFIYFWISKNQIHNNSSWMVIHHFSATFFNSPCITEDGERSNCSTWLYHCKHHISLGKYWFTSSFQSSSDLNFSCSSFRYFLVELNIWLKFRYSATFQFFWCVITLLYSVSFIYAFILILLQS